MSCIIKPSLFTLANISNEEFIELYKMIGGWYVFWFRNKDEAFQYMINAILDVIGHNVDVVTLEKESLFKKIKTMIRLKKTNTPFKEVNVITKSDYIYLSPEMFHINYNFDIKYNFKYEDFESKYKFEEFENLNIPEVSLDSNEKIDDLNIFGIEFNSDTITEKHKFLVNNLRTLYYQRAKVVHPDKGGNVEDFKKLSNAYQKLMKLRE